MKENQVKVNKEKEIWEKPKLEELELEETLLGGYSSTSDGADFS